MPNPLQPQDGLTEYSDHRLSIAKLLINSIFRTSRYNQLCQIIVAYGGLCPPELVAPAGPRLPARPRMDMLEDFLALAVEERSRLVASERIMVDICEVLVKEGTRLGATVPDEKVGV